MKIDQALVSSIAVCWLGALVACSGLLPKGETKSASPWGNYGAAQNMFQQIVVNQTTRGDLHKMGVDPDTTKNTSILNYVDLMKRVLPSGVITPEFIDAGLRDCLMAKEHCSAFEIEQRRMDRKRIGNFWADLFNFHRVTDVVGWRFDAIIVLRDDLVVYKLWSGTPAIHEVEDSRNPLGPAQSIGESVIRVPQ